MSSFIVQSLDVLDDAAVGSFVDAVVREAGGVDILIDVSGPLAADYGNGKMAVDLPTDKLRLRSARAPQQLRRERQSTCSKRADTSRSERAITA